MLDHPFVARIRAERALLKIINQQKGLSAAPLAGLSHEAIRRWANEGLLPIRDDIRTNLIKILLETSSKLRLGSSASHRGALMSAAPTLCDIEVGIAEIQQLLAQADVGLKDGQRATGRTKSSA